MLRKPLPIGIVLYFIACKFLYGMEKFLPELLVGSLTSRQAYDGKLLCQFFFSR